MFILPCSLAVDLAKRPEIKLSSLNLDHIEQGLRVIDCCRQAGEFDTAQKIISLAEPLAIFGSGNAHRQLNLQKELIARKDMNAIPDITEDVPKDLPSVVIRGFDFASAMWRWALSGFTMRTEEQISAVLEICESCTLYDPVRKRCSDCTCNCNDKASFTNKVALASEHCPKDKW